MTFGIAFYQSNLRQCAAQAKIKRRPTRQKLKQKTEEREGGGGWGLDQK